MCRNCENLSYQVPYCLLPTLYSLFSVACSLCYQNIQKCENPASLDRVKSYRKNKVAFMVGRLWVKEVRPKGDLLALGGAHLWLKLYD
ncbi:MAG: hypothetical protein F6K65_11740 [Moorea sp. SIO3C2]|nr:hypothetical protein [Moorena sp. SIO3C2]